RERARNAYYNNNTASAAFCREFSAPVHCALLKRRNNVNIISSRTTGKFNLTAEKNNNKIRVKNTTLTQAARHCRDRVLVCC
ncbi:AAEL010358-PA, partial [Aedes aegypti]